MEYIELFWEHDLPDEPTVILYEADCENDRLAERSIDIFWDGKTKNISALYAGVIEMITKNSLRRAGRAAHFCRPPGAHHGLPSARSQAGSARAISAGSVHPDGIRPS